MRRGFPGIKLLLFLYLLPCSRISRRDSCSSSRVSSNGRRRWSPPKGLFGSLPLRRRRVLLCRRPLRSRFTPTVWRPPRGRIRHHILPSEPKHDTITRFAISVQRIIKELWRLAKEEALERSGGQGMRRHAHFVQWACSCATPSVTKPTPADPNTYHRLRHSSIASCLRHWNLPHDHSPQLIAQNK
jgi:hypothetical protein